MRLLLSGAVDREPAIIEVCMHIPKGNNVPPLSINFKTNFVYKEMIMLSGKLKWTWPLGRSTTSRTEISRCAHIIARTRRSHKICLIIYLYMYVL